MRHPRGVWVEPAPRTFLHLMHRHLPKHANGDSSPVRRGGGLTRRVRNRPHPQLAFEPEFYAVEFFSLDPVFKFIGTEIVIM